MKMFSWPESCTAKVQIYCTPSESVQLMCLGTLQATMQLHNDADTQVVLLRGVARHSHAAQCGDMHHVSEALMLT